jgi:ribosomal protein S27AE
MKSAQISPRAFCDVCGKGYSSQESLLKNHKCKVQRCGKCGIGLFAGSGIAMDPDKRANGHAGITTVKEYVRYHLDMLCPISKAEKEAELEKSRLKLLENEKRKPAEDVKGTEELMKVPF